MKCHNRGSLKSKDLLIKIWGGGLPKTAVVLKYFLGNFKVGDRFLLR